jgi:hypothetical protein
VDQCAAVCEFLVRCGVSDHHGEGVTAGAVAEHIPIGADNVREKLKEAVERGDLETTPAVRLHHPGMQDAYLPTE